MKQRRANASLNESIPNAWQSSRAALRGNLSSCDPGESEEEKLLSHITSLASRALSRAKLPSRSSIIEQPRHLIINGCVPSESANEAPLTLPIPSGSAALSVKPRARPPGVKPKDKNRKKKKLTSLIQMAENVVKWQRGDQGCPSFFFFLMIL